MFSTRVALRTERVGEQAKKALRHIEAFQGEPCSEEHLLEMRRLSYSYRYIQEVLYLKDNVPQCSSWKKKPGSRVSSSNENHARWLPRMVDHAKRFGHQAFYGGIR